MTLLLRCFKAAPKCVTVCLTLGASALFCGACSESKPAIDVSDDEGTQMCCVLAIACDSVAETSGEGGAGGEGSEDSPNSAEACHELGHEGTPDSCRSAYEHCLDLCQVTAADESDALKSCE